jgi:hypothetical protein
LPKLPDILPKSPVSEFPVLNRLRCFR